MKFVKKVDNSFQLKSLFNEHISKFNLKNEQELIFLEDIRNFTEKKCQLELQYSQSLLKLCNQFLNKEDYQLNSESNSEIYIPEKWKLLLEQYAYIAEKKQVSSRSMLMHCEYFKKVKDQKYVLNQMAINYMKKIHEILFESHRNCESAFKSFCTDQFLCDQLDKKTKINNSNLEKKLKSRNINLNKFKKTFEELNKDDKVANERIKKLDFSKLNYVTANFCQNQQLQYYFSMEIPQLMNLQNGNLDFFIDDCLNSLAFKELESSKFLIRQFEEAILNKEQLNSESNENKSPTVQISKPHDDTDFKPSFFSFQKENIKILSKDYVKWSAKLNELESLMKTMLTQVNDKRLELINSSSLDETGQKERTNINNLQSNNDYLVDTKQEEQRFLIAEKNFQKIFLQAKIDALGSFNINLNDLDEYNNAANFEEKRKEFDSDLHQNLELWDLLMKSVDNIQYSDDSYDVEIVRKSSKDFIQSDDSSESHVSMSIFEPQFKEKNIQSYFKIPDVEPRYAKTLINFTPDNLDYISYDQNESLIIYDEIYPDVFRARNYDGKIGLVNSINIEFYKDEPTYVKSIYIYDGLDERELSFPPDSYIRLLRRNLKSKKGDGEEWYEGVYDNRIGFFPSIFVQELGEFDKEKFDSLKEDNNFDETQNFNIDKSNMPSPAIKAENNNTNQVLSPFTENQKVPQ